MKLIKGDLMFVYSMRASAILYNVLISLPNDKAFILPANICPIVPCVFLKAKIKFIFIDISNDTYCLDENMTITTIKKNPDLYGGVLFARTYGIMDSFEDFFLELKNINNSLLVIDDRCLAIPSFSLKENSSAADIILYSTGYAKIVDIGFGGFAWINNNNLRYSNTFLPYDQNHHDLLVKQNKNAIEKKERIIYRDSNWLNMNQPDVSFDDYIDLVTTELKSICKIKDIINSIYSNNIPSKYQIDQKYQLWRFNILVPNKNELIKTIFQHKLFASSHYASLDGIFSDKSSANAEYFYSMVINLFNNRHFDEARAFEICEIVNDHVEKYA